MRMTAPALAGHEHDPDHDDDPAAIRAVIADTERAFNTGDADLLVEHMAADGTPIDLDHTMTALYVLVREQGRWWIAARQNTLVSPPA